MSDLVSVIIPCFRQGHFLGECIGSLQSQTHAHWEALIVDDGSPDETGQIARELMASDPRVQLISQPNRGRSAAKNSGMRAARGQFIQFLDADDLLPPEKLARHLDALAAEPGAGLVYSNAWYFPDGCIDSRVRAGFGSDPDVDWIAQCARDPRPVLERLVDRNILPISAPLLRRAVMNATGLFDESLKVLEDWEYWVRCANAGTTFRFLACAQADALIRLHSASITQDASAMSAGRLTMALTTLRYVTEPKVRRLILAKVGAIISQLDASAFEAACNGLSKVTRSWDEVFALALARACGPSGERNAALRAVAKRLPWRLRSLADH